MITFPDVPEAITQGETVEGGIDEAADALEEAIVGRIYAKEDLPVPSPQRSGQYLIPVPAQTAFNSTVRGDSRGRHEQS